MIHIDNQQLKTVRQLLVVARQVNETLEQWASVKLYTEHMCCFESEIINIIFDLLDIDQESISPIAQGICQCVAREISIEVFLDRIRDPAS